MSARDCNSAPHVCQKDCSLTNAIKVCCKQHQPFSNFSARRQDNFRMQEHISRERERERERECVCVCVYTYIHNTHTQIYEAYVKSKFRYKIYLAMNDVTSMLYVSLLRQF